MGVVPFGVELDADCEVVVVFGFDSFDDAVWAPGGGLEGVGDFFDTLVVVGVDQVAVEVGLADPGVGLDADAVGGDVGGRLLHVLDADVGVLAQVLVEGPAQANVHQLHAPTDAENRKFALPGRVEDRHLEDIPLVGDILELEARLFAVEVGRQVLASGEDDGIDEVQVVFRFRLLRQREEDRRPTSLDQALGKAFMCIKNRQAGVMFVVTRQPIHWKANDRFGHLSSSFPNE